MNLSIALSLFFAAAVPDTSKVYFAGLSRPLTEQVAINRANGPVILIVVDKGSYVDAFWFFFYSFNLGNQVLGVRFGNHVADWEHTMIRFKKGQPTDVFFSEHEWGAGYKWEDTEKNGDRVRAIEMLHSI